jgi:DNA-binding transcriptional ArsR family regulator
MLPDDMDGVFHALAHRDRRKILDLVRANSGCCVEELCRHFATSRIAVLKHLRVLERAQLIHSEKAGRKRRLYFNVVPIQIIYDRWATEFSALWATQVAQLKYRVETAETTRRKAPRKRHA